MSLDAVTCSMQMHSGAIQSSWTRSSNISNRCHAGLVQRADPALFCLLFRVGAFLFHLSSRDHTSSSIKRDTATEHLTRLTLRLTNHLLSTDTNPVSTSWTLSGLHHGSHKHTRLDLQGQLPLV